MVKGKTKTTGNCENFLSGRLLRSRRKEGEESEAADPTVDTPSPVHLQDTEGNDTAVVAAPSQSALNQFSLDVNQRDPPGEESSPFKPIDDSSKEKHTGTNHEDKDVSSGCVAAEAHETTATHGHDSDSQLIVQEVHSDVSREEEALRKGRSLHIVLPGLVEGDGLYLTSMEKHIFAKVDLQSDLDVTKDAGVDTMAPDNELAQEAAVSFPPKKKRRMGMCGLTEKERSQFFLVQKRENGQNRNVFEQTEEKQGCDDNTADPITPEKTVNPPPTHPSDGADETSEREKELQPVNSEQNDSTETGASSETNPACEKEGNTCQPEEHTGLHLYQPDPPESDPSAEKPEDECSVNCELEEQNRSETESGNPEAWVEAGKDVSLPAQNSVMDRVDTVNTEEIGTQESTMAAAPQGDIGEIIGEEVGDTPAQTEVNCVQVELCESAVMPSVSGCEEKGETEDRPAAGSSPENNGHGQAEDATEPNGSDCLDYVSDSQLNTIDLIEDKVLDAGHTPESSCLDDCTNLICGLVKELSSLNRKVMAAHRELENLRRSSKGSRGSRR